MQEYDDDAATGLALRVGDIRGRPMAIGCSEFDGIAHGLRKSSEVGTKDNVFGDPVNVREWR
jgi:hypothetical protein